jgi:hypothetical protein
LFDVGAEIIKSFKVITIVKLELGIAPVLKLWPYMIATSKSI